MPEVVKQTSPHRLELQDRRVLAASGILSITSYDAQGAVMETPLGTLNVGGRNLCVSELSVQTGEVKITGEIEYVQYTAPRQEHGGFLKRLVR